MRSRVSQPPFTASNGADDDDDNGSVPLAVGTLVHNLLVNDRLLAQGEALGVRQAHVTRLDAGGLHVLETDRGHEAGRLPRL